jgi:lipopolysaccharide export system protein LptA
MKIPHALCAGLLLQLIVQGAAWAEKADRDKPMNIEADAMRYDDLRQLSVFTGQVVLSKGSILIRGGRVEVRQDAEGFQYGTVSAEAGRSAYYRQKREGVDETLEGQADSIEYNGKTDSVRLVHKAELRRLRGGKLNDEFSGQLITYDNTRDVFAIDGTPPPAALGTSNATSSGGSRRIRAMLTPHSQGNGSTPSPTATPAADPTAVLRSSSQLSGGKP